MMEQLKVLRRIKDLKEEQALRVVNARRREAIEAEAALSAARNAVNRSETTLPIRENAIFQPIIGHVVSFGDVEQTKADAQALQTDHSRLIDVAERAQHIQKRLQKQLHEAIAAHRKTLADQHKYTILTEDVTARWRSQLDYREEIEIEDLLISRRSDDHG